MVCGEFRCIQVGSFVRNNTLHKRKHGGVGCDLDPDGPLHGKLDEDDAEYHRKLLNTVFSLVRCGSTDKVALFSFVHIDIYLF
jgi:hypothetical protein